MELYLESLILGFQTVFLPLNLILVILGTMSGIIFGALPGISSAMGCVLLIPFTYKMGPISAMVLLTSAFCGSTYGGSITSILFGAPGTPSNVMTVLDGYPLKEQGRGGEALGIAISCSVIGGLFSVLMLFLIALPLSKVAMKFGPPEYLALAILGLTAISSLGSKYQLKALISACIGLILATIGADLITGIERFTFDSSLLINGVHFIPVMIGAFAVSEVFNQISGLTKTEALEVKPVKVKLMNWSTFLKTKWLILKSAILGVLVGILPGTGGTIASIIAYSEAVRTSNHPERFGKGEIEGVIAAETANNASTGGALIPTITLGIPGSGTTAVMLGAFIIHGLRPGPLLISTQPNLFYSILAGMFIANILLLFGGYFGIKMITQISYFPYAIQGTIILLLCIIGSYALNNDIGNVWVMLISGITGFFFKKCEFPIAPLILGLVLGELAEQSLRQSLLVFGGEWLPIFLRPVSGTIFIIVLISLTYPYIRNYLRYRK